MADTVNDVAQAAEKQEWFRGSGSRLLIHLGIAPGQTVLDFGCGPGRYSVPLSQAVTGQGRVLAVDRQDEPLAELRERLANMGVPEAVSIFQAADLEIFKTLQDDSLDAVLLFDVLQHVSDWPSLFAELARAVKPGGLLLVYPAAAPHPGKVDMELATQQLASAGFSLLGSGSFRMMHNVDMVDDTIYRFRRAVRD